MLQRIPIDRARPQRTEVRVGGGEHVAPRQIIRHAHARRRRGDHPANGAKHRRRDLQRRCALLRHESARLLDGEQAARPPCLVRMTEQQHAELVDARVDLVVQDPLVRLHLPLPHLELVHRCDRRVRRAVGVVNGRPVHGAMVVPHRQVVGDRERLAVADDHADDLARRHPRPDPRLGAHARQADLVAGTVAGMHAGVWWQPSLVRPPSHLGRSDTFLVEAIDAPGVDELVDLLWLRGDLRVALGDVDHLERQQLCEAGMVGRRQRLLEIGRRRRTGAAVGQGTCRDLPQRLLRPVRDEARVGAMLDHRRRTAVVTPPSDHLADRHVADVQRARQWVDVRRAVVGVPHLDRGVEVADTVISAPLDDRARVDVPGEIETDVASGDVAPEHLVEVRRVDLLDDVGDSGGQRLGDAAAVVDHVDHGDLLRRADVLGEQQRQRALRDRATSKEQDPAGERHGPPFSVIGPTASEPEVIERSTLRGSDDAVN